MKDIVIWFYSLILLMVKHPSSTRTIEWEYKFFNRAISDISPADSIYEDVARMSEELALCKRRRRSRGGMYNVANIDEVYGAYYINKSPTTLQRAWELFKSGRYRVDGC